MWLLPRADVLPWAYHQNCFDAMLPMVSWHCLCVSCVCESYFWCVVPQTRARLLRKSMCTLLFQQENSSAAILNIGAISGKPAPLHFAGNFNLMRGGGEALAQNFTVSILERGCEEFVLSWFLKYRTDVGKIRGILNWVPNFTFTLRQHSSKAFLFCKSEISPWQRKLNAI